MSKDRGEVSMIAPALGLVIGLVVVFALWMWWELSADDNQPNPTTTTTMSVLEGR